MKRLGAVACATLVVGTFSVMDGGHARAAGDLCVGGGVGCYATLEAAIDVAHDGDTIRIKQGTYSGGVTVDASVSIVGAGPASTVLTGGDSVLTIGRFNAPTEPTVSIAGLTITGGVARSSPESIPFSGFAGVWALGGGIEIPPSSTGTGATVTVVDTVIKGNRVAPTRTVPSGSVLCPGNVSCPFAEAVGGGIDNWGSLTVANSVVSDNLVGSASGLSTLASDAYAGGIMVRGTGTLVLNDSVIRNNHVSATAPNGRFADSGGVFVEGTTVSMNNDLVTSNSVELAASLPTSVQLLAISGGVHVSNNSVGSISNSTISDNDVTATNSAGDAIAQSGGLQSDGPGALPLINDTISDNTVRATTRSGSVATAYAESGAGEVNAAGPIRNTRFTGNTVIATSASGTAEAVAGAFVAGANPRSTIIDSIIADNRISATSTSGSAIVEGGAISNAELLTLQDTIVGHNSAIARGPAGMAQGGGIWNSTIPGYPPPVQLVLDGSAVIDNTVIASSGITVRGGGLYTTVLVSRADSSIADNVPDQCFGC